MRTRLGREKLISVTGPWEGGHHMSCRVTGKNTNVVRRQRQGRGDV